MYNRSYHREALTPVSETSQHPGSHAERAINHPHRSPLESHHPPLPSQVLSSRRRTASSTSDSDTHRHSRSSGLGLSVDPPTFPRAEHSYDPDYLNHSPHSLSSPGVERSSDAMAAHYHPYRTAFATSPVSAQYLSPDYYPNSMHGPGVTRRRSNSNDHRAPSPTHNKRLSDSHLRPMDYNNPHQSYSRPVSPLYGSYSPDMRHGSTSPGFGSYGDANPFIFPNDNSSFVEDLSSYSPGLSCSQCPYQALTSEALQRHIQKHQKSHHCRFPNCSRTEGFATPNDRERHEKSVHKIPGQYWKCMDEQCSSYGKEFSRRDNLKDHLRRMHPVPEGMCESDANVWRSRLADAWRYEKRSGSGNSPERRVSSYDEPSRASYGAPPTSDPYYGQY